MATVLALAGGLFYWRGPVYTLLTDRYEAWRFATAFDRVHTTLIQGDETLWSPGRDGVDANALLGELLTRSGSPAKVYRGIGPCLVLFVRSGTTSGQEWLAFACITQTGLEVFSFTRGDRRLTGYDRLFETRQFFGLGTYKSGSLQLDAGTLTEAGDEVITNVTVNGGRNTLHWSIVAATSIGRPSYLGLASQLIVSRVTPKTGWTSNRDWWPNTGDVELLEGAPPERELAAVGESLAISFVPDGRIALLAPKQLAVTNPLDNSMTCRALPEIEYPEIVAFSPDGLLCYAGETSGDEYLIPTLGGKANRVGNSIGMPDPFFPDPLTLMVLDNTRIRRIDCVTGAVTDEPKPAEHLGSFVQAKDVVAYMTYSKDRVIFVRRERHVLEIPDIQGGQQMSLSPDARWLALKGDGISVFDTETGAVLWQHDMNHDLDTAGSRIKWSRDGTLGAAAGRSYVYLWSTQTPKWAARFPHGRSGYWPDVAISDDGTSMAASAAGSKTIAYWSKLGPATRPAR